MWSTLYHQRIKYVKSFWTSARAFALIIKFQKIHATKIDDGWLEGLKKKKKWKIQKPRICFDYSKNGENGKLRSKQKGVNESRAFEIFIPWRKTSENGLPNRNLLSLTSTRSHTPSPTPHPVLLSFPSTKNILRDARIVIKTLLFHLPGWKMLPPRRNPKTARLCAFLFFFFYFFLLSKERRNRETRKIGKREKGIKAC